MIIKFLNAHSYRGPRTDHPKYPAIPRRRFVPGDIADVPVEYFEKCLEPYRFAQVHNAVAVAAGAAAALMEDMSVEQLRSLIEKHDLEDKVEGSGEGGRALKEDLIATLSTHFTEEGSTAADEGAIPDDAKLARMRVDDLVALSETRKIKIQGTGRDGKVLKTDLISALAERRQREDTARENDANLAARTAAEED